MIFAYGKSGYNSQFVLFSMYLSIKTLLYLIIFQGKGKRNEFFDFSKIFLARNQKSFQILAFPFLFVIFIDAPPSLREDNTVYDFLFRNFSIS
jgi:hypothetical protein